MQAACSARATLWVLQPFRLASAIAAFHRSSVILFSACLSLDASGPP